MGCGTVKTEDQLCSRLSDNNTGSIVAADLRDIVRTLFARTSGLLPVLTRVNRTASTSSTWTLSDEPTTLLLVFKNGVLLIEGSDYTVATDTITFLEVVMTEDIISAVYA